MPHGLISWISDNKNGNPLKQQYLPIKCSLEDFPLLLVICETRRRRNQRPREIKKKQASIDLWPVFPITRDHGHHYHNWNGPKTTSAIKRSFIAILTGHISAFVASRNMRNDRQGLIGPKPGLNISVAKKRPYTDFFFAFCWLGRNGRRMTVEKRQRLRKQAKSGSGNGHGPARHGGRDAANGWLILRE